MPIFSFWNVRQNLCWGSCSLATLLVVAAEDIFLETGFVLRAILKKDSGARLTLLHRWIRLWAPKVTKLWLSFSQDCTVDLTFVKLICYKSQMRPFCLWTKKKKKGFLLISTVPSFLVHKWLLTCSMYPLWLALYPAVTRLVETDKRQLLWCDLLKGRKNYISGEIRTESHFQHLADTLTKSDSQWVHGSNKIKFQGQRRFKQLERVDEPKLRHSDNRY